MKPKTSCKKKDKEINLEKLMQIIEPILEHSFKC